MKRNGKLKSASRSISQQHQDSLVHLIDVLYEALANVVDSSPFPLVYLLGTLKNLRDREGSKQLTLDIGVEVLLSLSPECTRICNSALHT